MSLKLRDLIEVSNNSMITSSVFKSLQEKLDEKELRDFKIWLNIVKQKIEEEKNRFIRKKYF